jgi:uncharacterized delta-60 repeat protein
MRKLNTLRRIFFAGSLLLHLSTICFYSHGAAGDVDFSFDPGSGVNGSVSAVVVQPDGKVIIGGAFTTVRGLMRTNLARLNVDGSGDATFNPGQVFDIVDSLALQPDGKVLVCSRYGTGCYTDDCYQSIVTRLHPNGALDAGFTNALAYPRSPYGYTLLTLQSDGKVLLGGHFNGVNGTNRNNVARLNANGTLDTSFNAGTGIYHEESWAVAVSLAVQSGGKILVGGKFDTFNGISRNNLARLHADGSVDASFNPSTVLTNADFSMVMSVALQPDGKVLVGGRFYNYPNPQIAGLARLNTDGSLDASFDTGTGPSADVTELVVQSDGKILVGGYFDSFNGTNRTRMARLNANGSLDTSFDPGSGINTYAPSIVVQSNGQVLVAGVVLTINGTYRPRLARLEANGSLDASFDSGQGLERAVSSLALQSDGKVLLGGPFGVGSLAWHNDMLAFVNGTNQSGRMRLNADGTVDGAFVSTPNFPNLTLMYHPEDCWDDPRYRCSQGAVTTSALLVQPEGKMLVSGDSRTEIEGEETYILIDHPFFARFTATGDLDNSFNPGTNSSANAMALQPDGKVIIGGGSTGNAIRRLNADGSLDSSFNSGTGANGGVSAIALQPDGKVLIGGNFTTINGTNRNRIARLNANGSLDTSFNPGTGVGGTNPIVYSVVVQSDGKVLIAGSFTNFNGTSRNHIARLNGDGSLDSSFNPGTGADAAVHSVALQPDGNVLIGGDFLTVNGVVRPRVARLYGDFRSSVPSLTIARSNSSVIVSWPVTATAFQLQQRTNLSTADAWTPIAQSSFTNAEVISVTVPANAGAKFFRLRAP